MRKLFFAICFIGITSQTFAATTEFRDEMEANSRRPPRPSQTVEENLPTDYNELKTYLNDRTKLVQAMPMEQIEKLSTMNSQKSAEYIASQTEDDKSTFQQIYESALDRLNIEEVSRPKDFVSFSLPKRPNAEETRQNWQKPDFDVINIELPNGEKIMAPAKEHIPYLLSRIDIMPNGMIRIVEIVNVVANGEKLKNGLSKALPKYSVSRDGERNRIIPHLTGVKINGTEVPYQLKDAFDRYLITPKKQFALAPGIYTYEFEYMLDRKLWYYKTANEFYWDVTGSFWNLVITRAISTVRLPVNIQPLGQTLMLGYPPNNLTTENTVITQERISNGLGFAATTPLFPGEGMHILISIPKAGFIEPDFNKKFEWFTEDYGDIIFSVAGFIAMILAYFISWKSIENNKNKSKSSTPRNPAMMRMLAKGLFDKTSFISFLLDLYRKGIIDIREENYDVVLIKKSDNLNKLNPNERKALRQLFGARETSLSVNAINILRFKRAYKFIEKDTNHRIKLISLKLNSGYILFSAAMLLFSEIAMSYLSVNPWPTFGLLLSSTLTAGFYLWLFNMRFKRKWMDYTAKIFSVIILAVSGLILSINIHVISALFILAMIYTIFVYSRLFSKRNGLIKSNIVDAQNYARNLADNAQKIILGHEFKNQQPNIFALDVSDKYPLSQEIKEIYKLELAQKIRKML